MRAAIGRDVAELRGERLRGHAGGGRRPDRPTSASSGVSRVYLQVLDLHDLDHLAFVASEVATQL